MVNKSVLQVSVSEDGSLVKDSSVILEIPPATTIAYGVIELFIKHNGQFGKRKALFCGTQFNCGQNCLSDNNFCVSLCMKMIMLPFALIVICARNTDLIILKL